MDFTNLIAVLIFVAYVALVTVLANRAWRTNNHHRALRHISVLVHANRDKLIGSVYFGCLILALLAAALWGAR